VQNGLSQQPHTSDENFVFNYLCGSKIGNITRETEAITNGYDGSLITFETFIKTAAVPSFLNIRKGGLS
jgi:hypothetical protein